VLQRGQHEHDGVLGHRDGVRAAVHRHGQTRASSPGEVEGVVADAHQLHQLEPVGVRQGVVREVVDEPHDVVGAAQRLGQLVRRHDLEAEAGRQEALGDLAHFQREGR
jgi:hypothetical protein